MSNRYKASIFSSTAATSTTSAASGVWKLSDIAQAITAGLWPIAAATSDALFNYVSLLMPFDSTNGKTNNTFLDSSTNNFTITRNGTPTQGTFTPFSQTGWGGNLGSGSNYLTVASNAILALGNGDFTVELWVYPNSVSSVQALVGTGNGGSVEPYCYLNSAIPTFLFNSINVATGPAVVANTWTHVAFVRSGSTITVYTNGVSGTAASPYTTTFTTSGTYIGTSSAATQILSGYLSNVRIVKGTAVYTANFTPPTAPLTAITNTTLLTLQSNYFKDNSTNAFTILVTGTPSIQAFSPFLPTAAYDSATNGGTVYFNGSTDYLTAPSNAAFAVGTVFTVEFWMWSTTITNMLTLGSFQIGWQSSSSWGVATASVSWDVTSATLPTASAWNHIAVVRTGLGANQTIIYLNGVSVAVGTYTPALTTSVIAYIGSGPGGASLFGGYMSNLRIVKGTAVYTAAFTPPTAPLTAITNTSLLLSGINAGAIDNASKNTAITNSSAQISTAISKWGGSSLFCSLAADKLTIPDSPLLRFGTGDFTVEGWVYINTASALRNIVSKGNTTTTGWTIGIDSINRIFATYTSTTLTGTTTLSANTWYYFAMVRSGTATGNIKLYINGTLEATSATAITTDFNQTDALYIGSNRTGTTPAFDGYIDDIRITKAARTVTTTPTAAFNLQ